MSRRSTGILVIVGAGVALAGAVVAVVVLTGAPAPRNGYAITAIGRDEAVLLTRRDAGDDFAQDVALVHPNGAVVWRADLDAYGVVDTSGAVAVAARDDAVFAFAESGPGSTDTRLLAFARATGERLWEAEVDTDAVEGALICDGAVVVDADRVYVTRIVADGSRVDAFDRRTGAHAWRATPGRYPAAVRLSGSGLAVIDEDDSVLIDRATGRTEDLPKLAHLCDVADGALTRTDDALLLLADGADPARYPAPEDAFIDFRGPCGQRDGALVVSGSPKTVGPVALLGFDRVTRAHTWTIPLDAQKSAAFASDGGELPRLLPALVSDGADSPLTLVVVDLADRAVVARSTLGPNAGDAVAIAAAGRGFVWLPPSTLVALDPETGAVAAAVDLGDILVRRPDALISSDVRFGRLWRPGDATAPADPPPLVVTDLRSGATTASAGLQLRDVTAAIRAAWLPAPAPEAP